MDVLSREKRDAPAAAPFVDRTQHQLSDNMAEVKTIVKQMQAAQYASQQVGTYECCVRLIIAISTMDTEHAGNPPCKA